MLAQAEISVLDNTDLHLFGFLLVFFRFLLFLLSMHGLGKLIRGSELGNDKRIYLHCVSGFLVLFGLLLFFLRMHSLSD